MFEKELRSYFHEANPAGIVHFAHLFILAHEVYEDWVGAMGFIWDEWFNRGEWIVAVKTAEAEYLRPTFAGRALKGRLVVSRVGESSFALTTTIHDEHGELLCSVKTVHVFRDRKTIGKIAIPSEIRQQFTPHLVQL